MDLYLQSNSNLIYRQFILDAYDDMYLVKWIIAVLIGTSIGIVIGFSIYHYFFMDKFSCCGVYGWKK